MSKHTPGPWIIAESLSGFGNWVNDSSGRIVSFHHTDNRPKGENNANARLIAAAPLGAELADMVLEMHDQSEGIYYEHNPTFRRIVDKAKEFQAKAEGK